MPIIREEVAPDSRGTKGRLLKDVKELTSGQSIEYEYAEFFFQTKERFRRSVEHYMYEFRKNEGLKLKITWTNVGFKIYVS